MRQAISTIRWLLRGERLEFNGVETRLGNVSEQPTPVYMTAGGPRMMEMAGEVADGAMILVGLHPKSVAAARARLETGARRVGRDIKDFRTVFITPTTIGEDSEAARRWPQELFQPRQSYLTYPSKANLFWLREAGIDLPDDVMPEHISDEMAERICDAFGLFGTAQQCLEQLKRAATESGVDHVFIFPTHTRTGGYDMPQPELDAFRDVIFPGLCG